jgi:hypothetical protein
MSSPTNSVLEVIGFPPEADYSKIHVLRYMPLDRFLSLVEFEAMWFSRLGALQDKFECTDPQGFRAGVLALDDLSMHDEELRKRLHAGPWSEMVAAAEHGRSGDEGRHGGAVNCWFLGESEVPAMWKEYGDVGKGVAIQSTVKRLTTAFSITHYAFISRIGRVNYVDFKTHSLGNRGHDMLRAGLIKDKTFVAENEVRIITLNTFHPGCLYPDGTPFNPQGPFFLPRIKGFYIKCRLQELVQRVIVGPNTTSNFHMLMKRIIGRYGMTLNIEHSQLPPLTL